MLLFSDSRLFAQGVCRCAIKPVEGSGITNRLVIPVLIEGRLQIDAVIDTGGAYLVCNSEVAEFLRPSARLSIGQVTLSIRGTSVQGTLQRIRLEFLADKGEGLEIEATAFIPHPNSNILLDMPVMLGLHGCMERLRFAIDPGENSMFYFGAMD